jgi:hypothetical protein
MSDKQVAFDTSEAKPSSKEEFYAQAEKWHKAQIVFFADIEKRKNENKKK